MKCGLFKILLFLLSSSVLQANTDEIMQSILGGAPYLVSYQDEVGPSKREAGIYVRDTQGNWKFIFPGKVFAAPVKGGLHVQLGIAKVTRRFESVAVVDGKVTLFSVKSHYQNSESFIQIGSPSAKVRDPIQDTSIEIPLITSTDEVQFLDFDFISSRGENLQGLLVSIKKETPYGDGITFALVLNSSQQISSAFKLEYTPILLDWRYQTPQGLSQLIIKTNERTALSSFNLLEKLRQPKPTDTPLLKSWRESLERVITGETAVHIRARQAGAFDYPHFLAETGKVDLSSLPMTNVDSGAGPVLIIDDPIYQKTGIYSAQMRKGPKVFFLNEVSANQILGLRALIPGAVSFSDNVRPDIQTKPAVFSESRQASLLQMQDGRVLLLAQSRSGPEVLPIKPLGTQFANLTPVRTVFYPIDNHNLAIISWNFGEGQAATAIYQLEWVQGSMLRITSAITISDQFFDEEELDRRVQSYPHDVLAIDVLTPHSESRTDYDSKHKFTSPHIDLNASLKEGHKQEYYPESLARETVADRIMYVTYEEDLKESGTKRTGFYAVTPENERAPQLLSSQVLKIDEEKLARETIAITFGNDVGEVGITPFLADNNFGNGQAKANIVLGLSPGRAAIAPQVLDLLTLRSLDQLKFFKIIKPEGNSSKGSNIRTLVGIVSLENVGTFIFPIQIQYTEKGAKTIPLLEKDFIKIDCSIKEILARIQFEDAITPYWIETPNLSHTDTGFKIKNIITKAVIEPAKLKEAAALTGAASEKETDSWRVYAFRKTEKDETARLKNTSDYQSDMFPHLRQLLDDLANPTKKPRHVVLIVPEQVKRYAEVYPFALKAREFNRPEFWSDQNVDLLLYKLDPNKSTQNAVVSNLADMHDTAKGVAKRRPLLFATLAQVHQVGHPVNVSSANSPLFLLSETQLQSVGIDLEKAAVHNAMTGQTSAPPSLLYFIATEGEKRELREFNPTAPPSFSTFFVGTREEWEKVTSTSALEKTYGVEKNFEVIELLPPSRDFREDFIKDILRKPEIKNLGYTIDISSFVTNKERQKTADPEKEVATYLVNRIEQLASRNGLSIFDGFMKAMNTLVAEFAQNDSLRNKKLIDRGVIENILLKTFSMPVNLTLLPPADPLRILSRLDAPFLWQLEGYIGCRKLKLKIINTILSQLADDDAKKVPSSFVLYGDTGSGKTAAIQTLIKMLGLKEYNFFTTDNKKAQSFFLSMSQIYDGSLNSSSNTRGMFTMEEAMAHFEAFLASENAERGFIWLDDFHLAPPKARALFLNKIRSLLENKTFAVTLPNRATRERPTRNLTIGITLNLTDNQSRVEKFQKKKDRPATDEELLLATISSPDGSNDSDSSILSRFGTLINNDVFPAEAKGPKLTKSTKESAASEFSNSSRYHLISPEAIDRIVSAFPEENARTFLSTAGRAILKTSASDDTNQLFIVVPKRNLNSFGLETASPESLSPRSTGSRATFSSQNQERIEEFITQNIEAIPIEMGYRGQIEFAKYLADNVRKQVFEVLLWSLSKNTEFVSNPVLQRRMGAPLARAIYHHLKVKPGFSFDELNFDPGDFGISSANEKTLFRRTLAALALAESLSRTYRLPEVGVVPSTGVLEEFVGAGVGAGTNRTRQHVLAENISRIQKISETLARKLFRVDDLESPPSAETWIRNLDATTPDLVAEVGKQIVSHLHQYIEDIFHPIVSSSAPQEMSQYDAMRFFVMAFDKALSRLPWGKLSRFLVRALKKASEEISIGQTPGLQHVLFGAKDSSPLVTSSLSLVLDLAETMPFFEGSEEKAVARQHERFTAICANLLKTGDGL